MRKVDINVIAGCESDEAIHPIFRLLDCFAELVIGPATWAGPVGSQ